MKIAQQKSGSCMRMMALSVALLLWPVPFLSTGVSAAPRPTAVAPQDEPMNFTLEGKITKLEHEKLVVSTEENIIFHVRYTDKTSILREDGSVASEKDLKVGITVRVEGDLSESGEIVAKKIRITGKG